MMVLHRWRARLALTVLVLVLIVTLPGAVPRSAQAQADEPLEIVCGAILEGEFTDSFQHTYTILLPAGTTLSVDVIDNDPQNDVRFFVFDYAGDLMLTPDGVLEGGQFNGAYSVAQELPYTDTFVIQVFDENDTSGRYTVGVGCVLPDGTEINPGDTALRINVEQYDAELAPDAPSFTGYGFPGLGAVNFAAAVTVPLVLGAPNTGSIAPDSGTIYAYTVSASAGDEIDLSFSRLSGNLNLGLAVIHEQNTVIFYSGLVSEGSLFMRFALPLDGDYTVGVYVPDLLPPDAPEPTVFQLQATLNS